jgi:predicted nucleotidyltransferase component of viral defense system
MGQISYTSVVTGEDESIKVEISLRETILLPTEVLPARTILLDPSSQGSAFPPVVVRVLSLREAYAEKIRAALTRREPAIRDFFDIDSAVRRGLIDYRSRDILDLVVEKLSVFGNEPVDTSEAKVRALEGQIETLLRPVLRPQDFDAFELPRVVRLLEEVVRLCPKK